MELIQAIEDGDVKQVNKLVKDRPTLIQDRTEQGWTALHRAIRFGYVSIAELLLSSGADANALDLQRFTPMHNAAMNLERPLTLMNLLCLNGANIDVRNVHWMSPLMVAAQYSNLVGVSYLLGKGARTDFKDRFKRNAYEQALYQSIPFKGGRLDKGQRQDLNAIMEALQLFY